ncbi:MAG: type II toxin-antitoxin system PemK/MazF family toxin [Candidatus Tectomicrobia bacterium]|uniref:Type II toxin-antitoxin system PemK/MazF family toxin n=1 Tax=Tectimicrobiota bacterium TaxID=2528274 RepID=A0A933LQV9_UNCTE|nr:type II toxin-antitoxin system PemK/MazF family toxin [Candidatus Tectomicrobia bacterium]
MMEIERGDIVMIEFPFGDKEGRTKFRPALVVQNNIGNRFGVNAIVIMITSVMPTRVYPVQVLLPVSQETGLEKPSIADAGVVYTILKSRILRKVGICPQVQLRKINEALRISLDLAKV